MLRMMMVDYSRSFVEFHLTLTPKLLSKYSCCPFKVHFRANVMAYLFRLARKWTFDGHRLYMWPKFYLVNMWPKFLLILSCISCCSFGGNGDSDRIDAPSGDPRIPTGISCWNFWMAADAGGTDTVGPRDNSIFVILNDRFDIEGEGWIMRGLTGAELAS